MVTTIIDYIFPTYDAILCNLAKLLSLVLQSPGAKKGLVVAKKLVIEDIWLVVNGGWASCKHIGLSKTTSLLRVSNSK